VEQGLQGPQGVPGNTNVLTERAGTDTVAGTDSKTLEVPGFGNVNVSCTTGVPSVTITGSVAFQGDSSDGSRFGGGAGSSWPLTSSTNVGEVWITTGLTGAWEVNFVLARIIIVGGIVFRSMHSSRYRNSDLKPVTTER
jgi:hypothetical protein